ncbi:MAG: MalY/PatB family protein, partial [Rikenellaceae bacterium]
CRCGTLCEKYDNTKEVFGREDIIPLWIADTDFKTPDFIVNPIKSRIEHPSFGYSFRCKYFYEAARSWVWRRNNWDAKLEWFDFTPGVVCGISYGINSLTEPGDKVLIQPPVYPPFARTIEANNRVVSNNPLVVVDGKYEIDFEDFEEKLKEVKLFILCNPHNPTGRVFTYDELKKMGDLCVKYGVYIVSDEIHSDIIFANHKHIHIASISEEIANITLTYFAPSKTFNVAGFSTAFAVIPNEDMRVKYSNCGNKIHVDQGNILGAVAARAAYSNGDEWVDELNVYLESNIDYVLDFLRENTPKIKCIKPESTFLLWLDCRELGLSQEELCEFMVNVAHLGLNDGQMFGAEGVGFLRFNIGTQKAVLAKALEQLKAAYDTL